MLENGQRTRLNVRPPLGSFTSQLIKKILLDAYVAISPISRKQTINPTNTDLIKVDITELRGDIYNEKNTPFGFIASRNININTVITDKLTELPIIVKKGARVMIRAQSNTISVKMNGESLENGIFRTTDSSKKHKFWSNSVRKSCIEQRDSCKLLKRQYEIAYLTKC